MSDTQEELRRQDMKGSSLDAEGAKIKGSDGIEVTGR